MQARRQAGRQAGIYACMNEGTPALWYVGTHARRHTGRRARGQAGTRARGHAETQARTRARAHASIICKYIHFNFLVTLKDSISIVIMVTRTIWQKSFLRNGTSTELFQKLCPKHFSNEISRDDLWNDPNKYPHACIHFNYFEKLVISILNFQLPPKTRFVRANEVNKYLKSKSIADRE